MADPGPNRITGSPKTLETITCVSAMPEERSTKRCNSLMKAAEINHHQCNINRQFKQNMYVGKEMYL